MNLPCIFRVPHLWYVPRETIHARRLAFRFHLFHVERDRKELDRAVPPSWLSTRPPSHLCRWKPRWRARVPRGTFPLILDFLRSLLSKSSTRMETTCITPKPLLSFRPSRNSWPELSRLLIKKAV